MFKYRDFPGPHILAIRLNTEIYSVNLRIQSEHRKIQTKKIMYSDMFHPVAGYKNMFKISSSATDNA